MPYRLQNCLPATSADRGRSTAFVLILLILSGCGTSSESEEASDDSTDGGPLSVAVTSFALEQMASEVSGEIATVTQIIPFGQTSREWKPKPEAILELQQADLILINGAGYEKWRATVSLPASRVVDTASGYYDLFVRIPDFVTHQHGPDGAHSHPGTVWATWLDPQLARAQLDRVVSELSRRDPTHADDFGRNAGEMRRQLDGLEEQLSRIARESSGLRFRFVTDGPYYHYLLRHFDQPLTYLHWPAFADRPLTDDEKAEFLEAFDSDETVVFLISSESAPGWRNFASEHCDAVVSVDLMDRISDTPQSLVPRLEANINNIGSALNLVRTFQASTEN